jgi:ferredoxin-NADP reductase
MTELMDRTATTTAEDGNDSGPAGELLVKSVTWQAEGVLSLRLVDPAGARLAPWRPGAHLELVLPSGLIRQYSLCGPPEDRYSYTIAVLHTPDSRGGSREVHETALAGRRVSVRGPRNRFPLVDASRYLFIAGGIGVTPILAMVREVAARGAEWRLVYGGRSRSSMAFAEELAGMGRDRVDLVPQDERGLPDLDAVLAGADAGTAVYCCGPEGLLAAVGKRCEERDPPLDVHFERFGPAPASSLGNSPQGDRAGGTGEDSGNDPDGSFEVELRCSGEVLTVPPDRSILDTVREVLPELQSSCEEGFCGTCETRVLEGTPEHRDSILNERERARGRTMMICVGRSRTPRLVLDL